LELDRYRVEFLWERYCRSANEFDSERYEELLLGQFRPMLRGLVFRLHRATCWLFPGHGIEDYFALAELAFVLAIRELKAEQVGVRSFLGCLPTRCLFQFWHLLRSEFEFSSSAVWDPVSRGAELPSSVLDIIRCVKLEDLLAPDQDEDDEPRDALWLASHHRDLDPQQALELLELAREIWSGLCSGELRVPERWQQGDELLAFLRECGLQISELDYRRMLHRNKARRARARA
jgi:hypothetical protein